MGTAYLSITVFLAAMAAFYKDAVTPYFPLVASLNYGGPTTNPGGFVNFLNACPAGTFAKAYLDIYAHDWQNGTFATLDAAAAACDAQGIPFGISEWGSYPSIDGYALATSFMTYVQNFMLARVAAGLPISDLIWYNGPGPNTLAQPITNPPQPSVPRPRIPVSKC